MLSFRILGPVAACPHGSATTGSAATAGGTSLGAPKVRGMLATLLLAGGHIVPLDSISAALWDGEPPRSALANMRTYASQLRAAVNRDGVERLHGVAQGYALRLADGDEFDLECFRSGARRGRDAVERADHEAAIEHFAEALRCWRGPAGADLSSVGQLAYRLRALHQERLAVIEDYVAARLRIGATAQLQDELRSLTLENPLRERLWADLMQARYQLGDIPGALEAYREAHAVLQDELGVEPGSVLVDMHRAILNQEPGLDPARSVPAGSDRSPAVPRELPPTLGRLVGRDAELAAIRRVVTASLDAPGDGRDGSCVVVLHGPPGAGTSALTHHAAASLREQFPDGQLYLDIAAVSSRVAVDELELYLLTRMLRSLDLPASPPPIEADDAAARFRSAVASRRHGDQAK